MIVEVDGVVIVEVDFKRGLAGLCDAQVGFLEVAGCIGFGIQLTLDVRELGR